MAILNTGQSAQFNDNGRAVVTLSPGRAGQRWRVARLTTIVTPSNGRETLKVYRNIETPSSYLDGSRVGGQDISETNISLSDVESLVFVWENGTPGSIATCTIAGDIY